MASSAAAAAGISVTQQLIRRRAADRELRERMRFRIDPSQEATEEVRRIAAGQLDHALVQLNGGGADAEGVHEARKALKRSRALLRVSRHLIPQGLYRAENTNLRDAGRELSETRDDQVLLETTRSLAEQANGSGTEKSLSRLHDALEETATSSPTSEQDAAGAAAEAISQTRSRVPEWPLKSDPDGMPLSPGLRRIYQQGRQALVEVRRKPRDDDRWHELRKRSKDLWYASQLLGQVGSGPIGKVTKRARRLSELLGEDHDLAVLAERVQASPLGKGDAKVVGKLIGRRRQELHQEALRKARRLYRRKPGKFMRRLGLQ